MAKKTRSTKKKRTEPHMIVRELPDGLREVTVDGHTWIERPFTAEPQPATDDDAVLPIDHDHAGFTGS